MDVLFYWLARTALMLAVLLALWVLGWQHWTAVVGAAVIAWLISYAMFGSMHDAAARQLERWASTRFSAHGDDERVEDAAGPERGSGSEPDPAAKRPAPRKPRATTR